MENLSATPLQPSQRGGRSITILVVADVLNKYDDIELSKVIINDFVLRDAFGFEKHGQNLETHDGRPTKWDLYQELLDACQYARKDIEEGGTVGRLVYEGLLRLTRVARKSILEGLGDSNDSNERTYVRISQQECGDDAQGNCQFVPHGGLRRSS